MPRYFLPGLAFGALAAGALMLWLRSSASAAPTAPSQATTTTKTPTTTTPVLVELFTSEGCSSCPPADALAAKLLRTQPAAGAQVIVLAQHVDYWNYIGWTDPFSSPSAASRQRSYAQLGSGMYTPQAVIDGRTEAVGSKEGRIVSLTTEAAKLPHAKVDLETTERTPDTFDVVVRVGVLPDTRDGADVIVATVQDRGKVAVPRGENSGRTLEHVSIARDLRTIAPADKNGGTARTTITVPTAVAAPDGSTFSIVAFIQQRGSKHVLGSAIAPLRPAQK